MSVLLNAIKSRRLKLGDTHPHTIESINSLIDLNEAWNKPEKAEQWRAKLPKKNRLKNNIALSSGTEKTLKIHGDSLTPF